MTARERIPIASDHAGVEMKRRLVEVLREMGYEPQDLGTTTGAPSDYPDFAHPLAREVSKGEARRGVLLCGSGVGMDIVANRYPHVRAALAWMPEIAALSRKHNDSNVLVLPSRFMSPADAEQSLRVWMETDFEGGRHERRVEKIDGELP
jgi:ribose 5-phosphate isomerase B